jgi:hypothetical protein
MNKIIGRVAATEKIPTTIDEFYFWTDKEKLLNPFDIVKVKHVKDSITFGVVEEISHITDAASYLTSYISNDFGNIDLTPNTHRIGMNFVKAKVVGNTENIYIPVLDGSEVCFAEKEEIMEALGLKDIKNPLPCGYVEMYEGNKEKVILPVYLNSHFLLGPDGAHLNISGISGLAAKTSYSMFLIKALQQRYIERENRDEEGSVAFVLFNVKGTDLLTINEPNPDLGQKDKELYKMLEMDSQPFQNVKFFYPYSEDGCNSYAKKMDVDSQIDQERAFKYKYIYEKDRDKLDLLFANVDDSTGTMDSIVNFILTEQGEFGKIRNWDDFLKEIDKYCQSGDDRDSEGKRKISREITVNSWRKFKRIIKKSIKSRYNEDTFAKLINFENHEVRLQDEICKINRNDVYVIDIARLDEDMQAFVFGDVIKSVYDLKLGQSTDREENEIPSKIIIFVDELNKYASNDVPKSSPILRQIIDITERGRSLGIILFSAEQFKSAIHDRITGNCSTHAYGRTNAIEISKNDYRYIPSVYKNMMTRLKQGEYIIQNPVFRSLLNIKFPKPLYKQVIT